METDDVESPHETAEPGLIKEGIEYRKAEKSAVGKHQRKLKNFRTGKIFELPADEKRNESKKGVHGKTDHERAESDYNMIL